MRSAIVAAIVVAGAGIADADPALAIHGTIVDRATRAPVAGAIVTIGSELAASGDDGTFAIAVPPGRYVVEVTAPWLEPTRRAIVLGARPLELVIEVVPATHVGGEIVDVVDLAPTAPGTIAVDAKLARTLPGGGDAAKVVQSLPAVARPQTGSAEVVVWGAAPQDTRTFVDGVPVPSLYHVGGYRAAVGNDLLGDIRLTPAAFGVDRGRAIGGVIDIGLADPASVPTVRAQADVLDAAVAGKVALGGGATIAAAVRQSWLDRAVDLVGDPATLAPNAPLPRWSDAQVVARVPLGDRLALTAFALAGRDVIDRALPSPDPATATSERTDRAFVRAAIALRRDRDDGTDRAMLWAGRDRALADDRFGTIPADLHQRAWVAGARASQQTRIGERATLTLGADVDGELAELQRAGSLGVPAREGDIHIFGLPPGDDVAADAWSATTIDAAGHALLDLALGRVVASAGVRVDGWMLGASRSFPRIGAAPGIGVQDLDVTVDPRASVQVRVTDRVIARADAGRYHQARAAADTSAVFGTPTLGLERAWHATAGGQWRVPDLPIALEAAAYWRDLADLVVRDPALAPVYAHALTQAGTGRVTGLEVTARVVGLPLAGGALSGWLSYNRSRSRRYDGLGQPARFFDHDQTDGLIAVVGYERGPWSVGGRVRYATGEPRTGVTGAYFDSRTGRFDPILGPHNGTRLPAYLAADARVERRFALGGGRAALYLEVQNLTNRANAEEIIYNADFSRTGYLTALPILAIAGARYER